MVKTIQALQNPAYRLADTDRMMRKSGFQFSDKIMRKMEGFGANTPDPSPFHDGFHAPLNDGIAEA